MISLKSKKLDKLSNNFIFKFLSKLVVKQILLALIITTLLFFIVVENIAPEKVTVNVGDVAPYDIIATRDIVDEKATEALKFQAMEMVEPIYRIDPSVQVNIKNEIKTLFTSIYNVQSYENININMKAIIVSQQSPINLSEEQITTAINTKKDTLVMLEDNIYDIIEQILSAGVENEQLNEQKKNVEEIFMNLDNLPENLKILGASIVNSTLKPNKFFDVEGTQQKKEEAANQISPVIIKKNQIIVRKGDEINSRALELIQKTGLLKENEGIDYTLVIGSLLVVFLLEFIIIAYLYIFNRQMLNNIRNLVILSIIILSVIIISKSVYGISGYLLPVATATMLISILIDAKLAILVNFVMTIIIGLITGNDVNIMVMCLVGGAVGAFGVINTQQRHNIFITGLTVGIVNMLTIIAFDLIGEAEMQQIIIKSFYGILNGVFSAILTIGSLPLWESGFGIVTPLKLLELSNPNHPLLKKLLLEAPGTYHHCILVGNLSEAAAEAVKGNPLVARVGAYYHDVGKLKRPYFFKENQLNSENPHDKINPNLSTLIITSHVKDGVELAKKYKLPDIINSIIQQHHGETLVAYFYHKALNGENHDAVKEDNFRYSGPKPQTKEAAIIMLADSVEAAVRSMREPTKGKIEGLVRQIIKDKLNDGQLDECDLTLKDLDTIANSFLNILLGIFHERIEYPKLDLSELKGGN